MRREACLETRLTCGLVVVAGFGVNSLVLRLIGTPGGIPFGNFSESLYGLASGGERWSYVYDQNSETAKYAGKGTLRADLPHVI